LRTRTPQQGEVREKGDSPIRKKGQAHIDHIGSHSVPGKWGMEGKVRITTRIPEGRGRGGPKGYLGGPDLGGSRGKIKRGGFKPKQGGCQDRVRKQAKLMKSETIQKRPRGQDGRGTKETMSGHSNANEVLWGKRKNGRKRIQKQSYKRGGVGKPEFPHLR